MVQRRSEIFGHRTNTPHRRQLLPGVGGVLGPVLTPLIGGGGQTTVTEVQTAPGPGPTAGYPPQPPGGPPQSGGGGPSAGSGQYQPPGSNGEPPPSGGQPSDGQPGQQSVPIGSPSGMAPGGVMPSAIGGSPASPFASGVAANGDPANPANPLASPTVSNGNNPISSAGYHSGTSSGGGGHGSSGGSSSGSGGPTGQSDGPQGANGASGRHGLTSGAIAGIVLSVLLALMVVLFVLWRRGKSRRSASRKWRFIHSGFEKPIERLSAEKSPDVRVPSTRNSLATDFDPALTLNLERVGLFDGSSRISRVFDPLAVSATPGRPSPISVPPLAHIPRETSPRNSAGSFNSDEGQMLSIPHDSVDGYLGSDHASIPFSPSESFASFEHPPGDSDPEAPQRVYSPESNLFSNQSSPTTKQSSLSPFVPASPGSSFAELQMVLQEKNQRDTGLQVGDVEIIRRLFLPSSNDELLVAPGDIVRIVKPFDTGWTLVEHMNGDREGYQGHVPTDCLSRATRRPCSFLR